VLLTSENRFEQVIKIYGEISIEPKIVKDETLQKISQSLKQFL